MSPQERIAQLEARIRLAFRDHRLALAAITHTSWANEHKDEGQEDNQRLEFLGDAAVNLLVAQRLMSRFPTVDEGELTKLRAVIVNEDGLAEIARSLRLGDLLRFGRGEERTGGQEKPSVLADALEAVVAAIYLGNGLDDAMAFVDQFFAEAFDAAEARQSRDSKSILLHRAQSLLKASPRYRVVSESGPEHDKVFEVQVTIGAEVFARSTGKSKKEAEQAAAEKTLEMLLARSP